LVHVEEEIWDDIAEYKQSLIQKVEELKSSTSVQLEKEKKQKLVHLKKQIKEIEDQEKNLLNLALTGLFTTEQIAEKKQELISKKELLTEQHIQLENEKTSESVKQEINQTQEIIDTIDKLPFLNAEEVNRSLKTFINKINYKREIPDDLLKLSANNEKRMYYPFKISVDYKK
jgi:hypothetical protein